ncbi:MAG TPA: SusC/RagA family TonB-linked outer membrane protein [Bacteroidales bacterium]|nr:SusC/RagA family TonB-linked outer membrane protein [Bacteroidales bacterium]
MKNKILRTVLIFCALFSMLTNSTIYAQERQVSTVTVNGQVITDNAQPVQGVVVKAFNTNKAALTDLQGNFSVAVSADLTDRLSFSQAGYSIKIVTVEPGTINLEPVVLEKSYLISGSNVEDLPYRSLTSDRNVSAVSTITGEELTSYPTSSLLDALAGRIPGLVIEPSSTMPGQESYMATLRGAVATIYLDGVMRDITGLSASEVSEVEVIKDLSGRAMLGLSGSGPVIWITTRKGTSFNKEANVSAEYGISSPTTLPKYLDAFNYGTLLNEALVNDGLAPRFTQADLDAYKNHTNPVRFPDINYYGEYVNKNVPFRKANVNFTGGDSRVTYFSMFDYVGTSGLETVGEKIKNDQYKLRGNVAIRLNDFMRMSVNISASVNKQRFPNTGSGAGVYNMFDILSTYPSNAHPISFNDLLIRSDNFPVNLDNELMHAGFGEGTVLNAQNNAKLMIDLGGITKGLSMTGSASFDVSNNLISNKGGTAALYRLERTSLGADTAVRIVEELNVPNMTLGYFNVLRRTAGYVGMNYDREFGKSSLTADATFYIALEEIKAGTVDYQPSKVEDLSFRANYSYDGRYVAQLDLAYSGSNRMPAGDRFSLYPTLGLGWVASNESFLKDNAVIDYLKVYTSAGIMGVNDFSLQGYNPFYLQETLWRNSDGWASGLVGSNEGEYVNNYILVQTGTDNFVLPKKRYLNLGTQAQLFNKSLAIEINYFNEKNYDKISNMAATTPTIIGSPQILPAVNYGEDVRWGLDGMIQLTKNTGNFSYGLGVNAMYMRAKYLIVDEPTALEEYKKLAGKDMDAFWLYESEGLFQSASEISSRNIAQSWGALQPGDIRYTDINGDDVIDENDIHATDFHSPRIFFGVNLSAGYKGFNLYILGQGVADGNIMLSSDRYFRVNGTTQNYSELMLDRWPLTNDYPRLTTVSENNNQYSTFWVANASYFRLKNVELSYTIPVATARKLAMSNFRIFARGTNLAVLSGLKKYSVDPENITAGINGYPLFRTVTVGVSCKF